MLNKERLLVIGLGNILMGDDGAAIQVIHELKGRTLPDYVDVVDGGTACVDLANILSGYRGAIAIDAIKKTKGDAPSDISLLSPDDLVLRENGGDYSIHDLGLTSTLRLMKNLDMEIPDITIIGIPATDIRPHIGLSEQCSRLVPRVVNLVLGMIRGGSHDRL